MDFSLFCDLRCPIFRLLTEDPSQRLGAGGASEVILEFLDYYMDGCLHSLDISVCFFGSSLQSLRNKSLMIQVKQHIFFKDINWDTLARQKV